MQLPAMTHENAPSKPSQATTPTPYRELRPEHIDRLFARMAAMYGSLFTDRWKDIKPEEIKAVWFEELSNYSVEQVAIAVKDLISHDFPPSLPMFAKLCEEAILRAPRLKNPLVTVVSLPGPEVASQEDTTAARARCMEVAERLGLRRVLSEMGAQ